MVYEKPLNGEFLMAHEKFLTTLITFLWYFYVHEIQLPVNLKG